MILKIKIVFIFLPQSGIKQSVAHASFRVLSPPLAPMPAIMGSRLCGCLREACILVFFLFFYFCIFVFLYFCLCGCLRQARVRALRRGFHLASERSEVVARQVVPEPVRHQLATIF